MVSRPIVVAARGPCVRPRAPETGNAEILGSPTAARSGGAPAHPQGAAGWSVAWCEPRDFRTLAPSAGAGLPGCAPAQGDSLLRQDDGRVLAGRLGLAPEGFEPADIHRPDRPATTFRIAIAIAIDEAQRPVEPVLGDRMPIRRVEPERIRAAGEVAAGIAGAVARVHERTFVPVRR